MPRRCPKAGVASPCSRMRLPLKTYPSVTWINAGRRPDAYAHDLYSNLRALDKAGCEQILVQDVPSEEKWTAIRDRLSRGAAVGSHRRARAVRGDRRIQRPALGGHSDGAFPGSRLASSSSSNLDTIIGRRQTRHSRARKSTALPSQTDLLNQQIAELQAAASTNAEQIKQLAAQVKELVAALAQAATEAAAQRAAAKRWSLVAMTMSVVALLICAGSLLAR